MLDLVYEYEIINAAQGSSSNNFSLDLFKQSYLCFNGSKVTLNNLLTQEKIKCKWVSTQS